MSSLLKPKQFNRSLLRMLGACARLLTISSSLTSLSSPALFAAESPSLNPSPKPSPSKTGEAINKWHAYPLTRLDDVQQGLPLVRSRFLRRHRHPTN